MGKLIEVSGIAVVRSRVWTRADGEPMPILGGATGTAMTDYLEAALLNEVLRATNFAAPATVYVGAYTTATGETGGGTEVTGNGYARQSAAWNAPSGGICTNTSDLLFPVATPSGWGTVTDWAISDASSAGNMLIYGTLTASKTINAGDQLVFRAGQLSVQFD